MKKIRLKNILKEAAWDHTPGKALPTLDDVQKAYNDKKHLQEGDIKGLNAPVIIKHLQAIEDEWHKWRDKSTTEKKHIKPAQKEFKRWIDTWFKQEMI